jgi:VanZ family protein
MSKQVLVNFINRWGLAILMMIIFFLASSIPFNSLPHFGRWDTLIRKIGHMIGYFMFALCLLRGLNRPGWKPLLFTLLIVFLYACTDELHQAFVPGRHSTIVDVGIDLTGAAIGACFYQIFTHLHRLVLAGIKQI